MSIELANYKRVLIFDLDGTLLPQGGSAIDASIDKMLLDAKSQFGFFSVIATGRSLHDYKVLADASGFLQKCDVALVEDGHRAFDSCGNVLLSRRSFYGSALKQACAKIDHLLVRKKGAALFMGEQQTYSLRHLRLLLLRKLLRRIPRDAAELPESVYKIRVVSKRIQEDDLIEVANSLFGKIQRSDNGELDIVPREVDKARTFAELIAGQDFDGDSIYVIGDSYNDSCFMDNKWHLYTFPDAPISDKLPKENILTGGSRFSCVCQFVELANK